MGFSREMVSRVIQEYGKNIASLYLNIVLIHKVHE